MACSKTKREIETGSDAEKETLCIPCKLDGDHKPAVKYCLDCNEPICQQCVDSHRRIKQIKNHKLVDHMTEDTLKLSKFLSTAIQCPKHIDKTIELECKDHAVMCCLTCATVDHRNCQHVLEVAGPAAHANMDSVTQNLMTNLTSAYTHMESIVNRYKKDNDKIQTEIRDTIPKQLQALRKRIDDKLNEMETRMLTASKTKAQQSSTHAILEIKKWDNHMESVTDARQLLQTAKGNGSATHLYITINKIQKTLDNIDDDIAGQGPRISTPIIGFKPGQLLQSISIAKPDQLASIESKLLTTTLPQYKPMKRWHGQTLSLNNPPKKQNQYWHGIHDDFQHFDIEDNEVNFQNLEFEYDYEEECGW